MKRLLLISVIALALVGAVIVPWLNNRLEAARQPAREIRAFSVAYDLRQTTNSNTLMGTGPEFRADLGRLLAWPTWGEIDHSPPGDRRGCIRLILTNDHGQALQSLLVAKRGDKWMIVEEISESRP